MENIHLNDVSEIINCVVVFPKKTIKFISTRTEISRDVIRHVLLYFYEYPFGGIVLCCEGIPRNADPFSMDCDILDGAALWSIDTSDMDCIPVENLNSNESNILFGLLNRLTAVDMSDILLKRYSKDTCMITKGLNRDTGKLFDFKQYPVIKKALLDRRLLAFIYSQSCEYKKTALKPLGIVYQSEEDKWYLVGLDESERIIPFDIEDIHKVHIGEKFPIPKQFDLKQQLQVYFSLESGEEEFVEIVFLDEAHVVEKAQRRLNGKGAFEPMKDGGLLFRGKIIGMRGFKAWLLGFGSSVIVRKPEKLKQEIIKELQGVVANYNGASEQASAALER